jgi:hypothetical protein
MHPINCRENEEKRKKNRIVEEVVEGVSTIRSGKQRKVSSKGKRKKKGNSFHEPQLFFQVLLTI